VACRAVCCVNTQAGFSGGLVVDYPHSTRAKKFFLVLMVGPSLVSMPQVGAAPLWCAVSVCWRAPGGVCSLCVGPRNATLVAALNANASGDGTPSACCRKERRRPPCHCRVALLPCCMCGASQPPQAKGTEAGAYEPQSDEDMEDAAGAGGAARMEARQRSKRSKGGRARALHEGLVLISWDTLLMGASVCLHARAAGCCVSGLQQRHTCAAHTAAARPRRTHPPSPFAC
jgi:hypothetical protein